MGAGRSADGRSALCMTFECQSNSGTDLSVLEQNGWQTLWEGKMLKVWHWDDELMRDVEGRTRKHARSPHARVSHGGERPHKDIIVSCSVKETQQ